MMCMDGWLGEARCDKSPWYRPELGLGFTDPDLDLCYTPLLLNEPRSLGLKILRMKGKEEERQFSRAHVGLMVSSVAKLDTVTLANKRTRDTLTPLAREARTSTCCKEIC